MNKVLIQIWEQSERGREPYRDGCSMHVDTAELKKFVSFEYDTRIDDEVPDEYARLVGKAVEAFVEDVLYDKIRGNGSVRINEVALRNLIAMDEITMMI